jgi:hypothetical protein
MARSPDDGGPFSSFPNSVLGKTFRETRFATPARPRPSTIGGIAGPELSVALVPERAVGNK